MSPKKAPTGHHRPPPTKAKRASPVKRLGLIGFQQLIARRVQWGPMMEREIEGMFRPPWKDVRRAADLAIKLTRLVLPCTPTPSRDAAEGGPPYRSLPPTHDVVLDGAEAQDSIETALRFTQAFVDGTILSWPCPNVTEYYQGDDKVSQIYWTATIYGNTAQQVCPVMFTRVPSHNNAQFAYWNAASTCAQAATQIVQKWAANSTGGGAAPNAILERATAKILGANLVGFDRVAETIAEARFVDALDGQPAEEDLRLAFLAAWECAKYAFAYRLLEPVEDG